MVEEKGKGKVNYFSRMEDLEKRYEEEGGGFWKENEEGEWVEVEGEEE